MVRYKKRSKAWWNAFQAGLNGGLGGPERYQSANFLGIGISERFKRKPTKGFWN